MSNKFDYHIKNHVESHEYDVDPQEIWEGILAKQQPEPKRKTWFFLLPIALCGLAAILWIYNDTSQSSNTTSAQLQSESPSNLGNSANTQARSLADTGISKLNTETANQSLNNVNGSTKKALATATTIATKAVNQAVRETITPQQSIFYTQGTTIEAEPTPTSVGSISTKPSLVISEKETLISKSEIEFLSVTNILTVTELVALNNSLSYNRETPRLNQTPFIAKETPVGISKNKVGIWSIAVTGGYGLFNKSIVSSTDQSEAFSRNETERPIDYFTSNLIISYGLNDSWSVSSGVVYQKAYEQFQWSGTYFQDAQGNVVLNEEDFTDNFNTLAYEKVDRNISSTYNTYEYLDIPILISYRPQLPIKLRTALTAGLSANILNINTGTVLNGQDVPVELKSLTTETKIGLRYSLGMSMMWPITDRLGLQVNGIYSLRNNRQKDLTLRYDYQEINLGLNFKIN